MIEGQYFDGRSSAPYPAKLAIGADRIVRVLDAPAACEAPLASVSISDRLGRTPRRIRFPDGAAFETLDNDGVDAALAALGHRTFSGAVDRWERRWQVAGMALLLVALVSVLFVRYGLPATANVAAQILPPAVDRAIGVQGLELLDKTLLEPSGLPAEEQKQLRDTFHQMTASLVDGHDYRLELRRGDAIGANAFALPDGTIVMTDELVALSENREELQAVFAHEIGHVRSRHALRMLLQSAGVAAITLAVFGDASSLSALATAVPTVLVNATHSRDFEREADRFARVWLREHNIPQHRFDDLLCKLAREHGSDDDIPYLSSHPSTRERAACSPAAAKPATP